MHVLPPENSHDSHRIRRILFWGLLVLCLSLAGVYANSNRFVARNVYFQDQLMEGLTRQQAKVIVEAEVVKMEEHAFAIQAASHEFRLTPPELGIGFDVAETVSDLFAAGWSIWLKAQVLSTDPSDAPAHVVPPVIAADPEKVQIVVEQTLSASERPVQNARIEWSGSGWQIIPALFGRHVAEGEAERITESILNDVVDLHSEQAFYRVRTERDAPEVRDKDLLPMLEKAQILAKVPVTVQFQNLNEIVDVPAEADQWFTLDYSADEVRPNTNKIASYVANFAARFDTTPGRVTVQSLQEVPSEYAKGETYKRAVIEGEFRKGKLVEQNQFIQDLTEALSRPDGRTVVAQVKTQPTEIVSNVPEYAFPDLISVGESSYSLGNKANRVHNIKTALKLEDLTVIPAGDVFSYNKVLGWVTYEKDFVDGQVIFGNTLANVAGGGVCQTSTTMFRAAVNAGLPILQRRNHSWDVHYYQDWHGVDATVYPPGKVDLVFKNDTPGPILVHSYTDDANEMAYFELYGTSDGRTIRTETVENVRIGAGRRIVVNWDVVRANGTSERRTIVSRYNR